jgi:hypothetical protein
MEHSPILPYQISYVYRFEDLVSCISANYTGSVGYQYRDLLVLADWDTLRRIKEIQYGVFRLSNSEPLRAPLILNNLGEIAMFGAGSISMGKEGLTELFQNLLQSGGTAHFGYTITIAAVIDRGGERDWTERLPSSYQKFVTRVVGTNFLLNIPGDLKLSEPITLYRDAYNPHDRNAVYVERANGDVIGWLPRELAAEVAPVLEKICRSVEGEIVSMTGEHFAGSNMRITIRFQLPA